MRGYQSQPSDSEALVFPSDLVDKKKNDWWQETTVPEKHKNTLLYLTNTILQATSWVAILVQQFILS